MKDKKLKKYILRFGIGFLVTLMFLTYFSSTIDNVLLPQVKVTRIEYGTIDGEQTSDDRYLIPLSAVIDTGNTGTIFAIATDENDNTTVDEISVDIKNKDDLYFEVASSNLYGGLEVVYSASKDISNGDRVNVLQEG